MIEGKLPFEEPLGQILRKIRSLPSEAVAQVAAVAAETLAARTLRQKFDISCDWF